MNTSLAPTLGALLMRWSPTGQMEYEAHPVLEPRPRNVDGVDGYDLYFGAYHAFVRVSQKPFSPTCEAIRIGAADRLQIEVRNFSKSSELRAMIRTVALTEERLAKRPPSK